MNNANLGAKINNIGGGCPHGSSPGACPLCRGGGGGSATKTANKNEMTWDQCYAVGLSLKAAEQRQEFNKQNIENARLALINQNRIENAFIQKIAQTIGKISNFVNSGSFATAAKLMNSVKNVVLSSFQNFTNLMVKLANQAGNLVNNFKQITGNLTHKLIDVASKLTSIIGEQEKNLKDAISKNMDNVKKKIFKLIEMIDGGMEQGNQEDTCSGEQVEENKEK